MADTAKNDLEMRISELEDKVKGMTLSESDLAAAEKVARHGGCVACTPSGACTTCSAPCVHPGYHPCTNPSMCGCHPCSPHCGGHGGYHPCTNPSMCGCHPCGVHCGGHCHAAMAGPCGCACSCGLHSHYPTASSGGFGDLGR